MAATNGTYDNYEAGKCHEHTWISRPGEGLPKRQCSLQCVTPYGEQLPLGIVSHGCESRNTMKHGSIKYDGNFNYLKQYANSYLCDEYVSFIMGLCFKWWRANKKFVTKYSYTPQINLNPNTKIGGRILLKYWTGAHAETNNYITKAKYREYK